MKKWIEVSPFNGLEEDAPTNSAGSGAVSMPPDAVHQKKKKKTLMLMWRRRGMERNQKMGMKIRWRKVN